MAAAVRCTSSSNFLIIFGVNARDTIRRSRACRGSSMLIIEPKYSLNSAGRSMRLVAPAAEENTLGVPARLDHVGVPDQRVVAALGRAERGLGRPEERRRLHRPQPRVRGVALRGRLLPEGVLRQVEVAGDGDGLRAGHVGAFRTRTPFGFP